MSALVLVSACLMGWVMPRLGQNKSVHLLAAGMSRSASTWQFNALRVLLEHAAASVDSRIEVHAAHGHALSDLEHCLAQDVCVVKIHEFTPALLARVDAVFVTHRDLRDVLMSSAGKINACLHSGKQPVASAFASYAAWLPFACVDMQYEEMIETGAPAQIAVLGDRLGITHATPAPPSLSARSALFPLLSRLSASLPEKPQTPTGRPVSTVAVAREIEREAHNPVPNQRKTGFMLGHITHVTTQPGAHARVNHTLMQRHLARRCNVDQELLRIESGWGRWLRKHNYSSSSDTNLVVDKLPQKSWLMMQPSARAEHCPSKRAWRRELRLQAPAKAGL